MSESQLTKDIRNLCRDLATLNPRHTNREGMVEVGPGRLANFIDTANRILTQIEEKENA